MGIADYWIDPCLGYWFTIFLNFVISIVNFFTNLIFGYSFSYGSKDEQSKSNDYEHSAQIVNIWFRGAYGIINNHHLRNFFWKHDRYVHPRHVLQHNHITLMGCTETHAFFCVSDPNVPLYDTEVAPFLWLAQFLFAQQLVIMPHSSLNRLAAEVGDPDDRKVTVIHMTARCGSTVLSQMFNRVPKTRVLSEPWSLMHLVGFYNRKIMNMSQFQTLSRSCLRILCAKEVNNDIDHIVIKMTPFVDGAIPVYLEMFPKWKVIFNTRLLKSALMSYIKVTDNIPKFYIKHTNLFLRFWWDHLPIPMEDTQWQRWTQEYDTGAKSDRPLVEKLAFGTGGMYMTYLNNKKRYSGAVCYEDLTKKSKETTESIFKALDVPLKYVDVALEAMKGDSQAGALGARGNKGVVITQEEYDGIDRMLNECGVPITCKMSLQEMIDVLK